MSTSECHAAHDAAAEKIFASIPMVERLIHADEFVCIVPFSDTSEGPPYVFGQDLGEMLGNAKKRFGPGITGLVLYMDAANTGIIPREVVRTRFASHQAAMSA
jgi:hypothetical protein